jgi:N-acetylglucosaminyldiphosphoundecaprenol N-acetyl-beta-D-mannosaminyltransferase
LNESEISDLQRIVSSTKPDIFWVGLSTPKQERFMAEFLQLLDTKIMIGVGAAFDFHTGRVRQAPRWIRQNGLEWLFRLIQEPKRLWSRYLNIIPRFLWLVLTSQSKTPKV